MRTGVHEVGWGGVTKHVYGVINARAVLLVAFDHGVKPAQISQIFTCLSGQLDKDRVYVPPFKAHFRFGVLNGFSVRRVRFDWRPCVGGGVGVHVEHGDAIIIKLAVQAFKKLKALKVWCWVVERVGEEVNSRYHRVGAASSTGALKSG